MMRRHFTGIAIWLAIGVAAPAGAQALYPVAGAARVNPDVQLRLEFDTLPMVGRSGQIRIYDADGDRLVDTLDLSIPAGPTAPVDPAVRATGYIKTPYPYARERRATNRDAKAGTGSGGAAATAGRYQLTIIGGFTDGFHFYPVTLSGKTATIHPHHDMLEYGHSYYVQVDPGVLIVPGKPFDGIRGKTWRFSLKQAGPAASVARITVRRDGSGDFDTVQGAMDWVPDHSPRRITVDVGPGNYEEIVYFRNKDRVTLQGAGEGRTVVRYANNEVFNPHPANLRTNEMPGTFPSRRAAFTVDNSNDIHIADMTIQTTIPGQAEGLLITGERNILDHVTVIGSGDALQANGTLYAADTTIYGDGDTILGRGTTYFDRCTLRSPSVMMWVRNTQGHRGNVFNRCTFIGTGTTPATFARAPANGGAGYPFAEAVLLNSTLVNIAPEGWGEAVPSDTLHYWEFASRDPAGTPVDVSRRAAWSRQLDRVADAQTIRDYSTPAYVLNGWTPKLEGALRRP